MTDTEPRVQQLSHGPYLERGVGSQDLASAGLCVFKITHFMLKTDKNIEILKTLSRDDLIKLASMSGYMIRHEGNQKIIEPTKEEAERIKGEFKQSERLKGRIRDLKAIIFCIIFFGLFFGAFFVETGWMRITFMIIFLLLLCGFPLLAYFY